MATTGSPKGQRQVPHGGGGAGAGAVRARTAGWQPLVGAALLERLRDTGRARPPADPVLVADLRSYLERDLERAGPAGPGSGTVVTRDRLTRALACPVHPMAEPTGGREYSLPLACGALVGVLFRQLVTTGTIGDALDDGLSALAVDGYQEPLVAWIADLAPAERSELRAEVERQADGLRHRWPALDPTWLPRTQACIRAPLAGGSIELVARVDLVVGRPCDRTASVALVDVTSGSSRPAHRDDRHFHALVETLRSTVPPFVVATYYTRTGELDVDPVTPDLLVAAARRCRSGIQAVVSEAVGSEVLASQAVLSPAMASQVLGRTSAVPGATVHPWCSGCAESPLQTLGVDPTPVVGPLSDPVIGEAPEESGVAEPVAAAVAVARPYAADDVLPFAEDRAA